MTETARVMQCCDKTKKIGDGGATAKNSLEAIFTALNTLSQLLITHATAAPGNQLSVTEVINNDTENGNERDRKSPDPRFHPVE